MKIVLDQNPQWEELTLTIHCSQVDDQVLELMSALRGTDQRLAGEKDGRAFLLEPGEICYFESVDKHTFLYTAKEMYNTPLRLYEVEERLGSRGFFRASKSVVINLAQVKSLDPMLIGGRIEVVLENGEHLMVSRQYVPALREKLGL